MSESSLGAPGRLGDNPRRPVRILAMDGGGLRGIIPLKVLARLERMTGRPTCELFDMIVGTSTGAIAALSLSAPGPDGRPRNTAEDMVNFYLDGGPQIFPRYRERTALDERVGPPKTHLAQRVSAIMHPSRRGNSRYLPVGLRTMLERTMADCRLSEALTEVIVPSYDMRHAEPVLFSSERAAAKEGLNPSMVDVAMATTAAPTYFPACRLSENGEERYLIDGGVVANNPAAIAYFTALQRAHRDGHELDVLLVSIGTGHAPHDHLTYEDIWSRSWVGLAAGMLGVIFDGTSDVTDHLLSELISWREPRSRYWRFQTELRGVSTYIDDSTTLNLTRLARLGDRLATNHHKDLVDIAALVTDSRAGDVSDPTATRTGDDT